MAYKAKATIGAIADAALPTEKIAHAADVERAARSAAPRNEAESEEMAEAEARGRARGKHS
jgi:hypothetical protein